MLEMTAYSQNVPDIDINFVIVKKVEATIKLRTQLVVVAIPFAFPRS